MSERSFRKDNPGFFWGIIGAAFVVFSIIIGFTCTERVPIGHVSVATLFGDVKGTYDAGLHFPVNPFYAFHDYDIRKQSLKESISVPSKDQMSAEIDFSFQWRVDPAMVGAALAETGDIKKLVSVHLNPKARSATREAGKSVERCEDFFLETTQQTLQTVVLADLKEYCGPRGMIIEEVLIRNIELPAFIDAAIQKKKMREQAAEEQKAELERYKTEQEQVAVKAAADRAAAEEKAVEIQTLADAKAYEIEKINAAAANNPVYVQLEALRTLAEISKDPSSKLYFMDGTSSMPLPLMHIGEGKGG